MSVHLRYFLKLKKKICCSVFKLISVREKPCIVCILVLVLHDVVNTLCPLSCDLILKLSCFAAVIARHTNKMWNKTNSEILHVLLAKFSVVIVHVCMRLIILACNAPKWETLEFWAWHCLWFYAAKIHQFFFLSTLVLLSRVNKILADKGPDIMRLWTILSGPSTQEMVV
jgi:hypothetical protein